jgi:hypothetical protein
MIRLRVLVIVAAMAVLALVLSACEGGPTELDELPLSELGGDCRTDANCVAGLHCCENTCHECCADYDCDEEAGERCDDDHKCVKVVEPPSEPETEPGEEGQSPPAPLPEEEQVVPLIEGETEDEWIQWFQEEWYWA